MRKLIALTAAVLFSTAIVACTAESEKKEEVEVQPLPPVTAPAAGTATQK